MKKKIKKNEKLIKLSQDMSNSTNEEGFSRKTEACNALTKLYVPIFFLFIRSLGNTTNRSLAYTKIHCKVHSIMV